MSLQRQAFIARAFGVALKVSTWLSALPNLLTPAPFRLMQISSAFWHSRALYVATELDIASVLADERLEFGTLATKVGANPDALHRLLRMLSAIGVFQEISTGVFSNSKLSNCLRMDHPQCVRSMVLMHNSDAMSRPWFEQLEHSIRTGQVPFQQTHHQDFYPWMDAHPDFDALFSQAMDSVEALAGDSFATGFDWKRFARVIDVGGSRGTKSVAILRKHPNLKALVVDRAQVIADAHAYWVAREPASLTNRLEFEAGDALTAVPAAQSDKDIYLLSAVLHGFDDTTCIQMLRTVRQAAAPKNAWIVVMEMVLADCCADVAGTAFDMQMFMATEGRERTLAEWDQLFSRSGLARQETVRLASLGKMLVLKPI
ncbi:MAG TPA: methyltransferase [Thiobacillus sp.]